MKPHIEVMRGLVARHDTLEAFRARQAEQAQRVLDELDAKRRTAAAAPLAASLVEKPRPHNRPCVSVLEDGRIGLFVGTGYRYLDRAAALAYARDIVDCVLDASRRARGNTAESRA